MTASKKKPAKSQKRRSRKVEPAWGIKYADYYKRDDPKTWDNEKINELIRRTVGNDQALAHDLGLSMDAAYDTYWHLMYDTDSPKPKQIVAALEFLESHTKPLLWALENLDYITSSRLEDALHVVSGIPEPRLYTIEEILDPPPVKKLLPDYEESLRRLHAAVYLLRTNFPVHPPQRGRRPNYRLNGMISILGHSYERVTGQSASAGLTVGKDDHSYWSPFIEFASAFLEIIDPQHGITNQAFGEAVRRTMSTDKSENGKNDVE